VLPAAVMAILATANVVTASYRPLELASVAGGRAHDAFYDGAKVDVYSAACVIAELLMLIPGPGRVNPALGGLFNPHRLGVDAPTWSREEQILMIVKVLGRPTEPELAWLRGADPSAHRSVMASLAGWWGGGAAAAATGRETLAELLPNAPPEGLDLLRRMMRINPAERLTAEEAMADPFFDELRGGAAGGEYAAEAAATAADAARVGEPEELHCVAFESLDRTTEEKMRELLGAELGVWAGKRGPG
jgi:serine/threonine protein kinase